MTTAVCCGALQYWLLKCFRRCLLATVAFYLLSFGVAHAEALNIIANPSVVTHQLSRTEIRQIFSASKQYWADGSKITVFVMDPRTSIHKNFCQQKLQMFPYQLERLWNQVTFSGQGNPPIKVASQEELVEAVKSTPGAIGYALGDKATNVLTIKVDNS